MRRFVLTAALMLFAAHAVVAQETPKVELFGGYAYGGGNTHGWAGSAAFNVNRWLGLAADFSGQYTSFTSPDASERIRTHSALFGPRFSLRRSKYVTPFVHALAGFAHTDSRARELGFDFHATDTTFVADLGGGLDINIDRRVAIRAFQLDYFHTGFYGSHQNNGRIAVGLVLRLGDKD
jgi:opacity protein-like surface antigen